MLQFLFPKDDFLLETSALPSVVRAKLQAVVSPPPTFSPVLRVKRLFSLQKERPKILYIGGFSVEGNTFTLLPYRHNRKWFRPRITGTIEEYGGGSRVSVRIRLHPLIPIMAGVYPFLLIVATVIASLTNPAATIPLWIPIVGGLIAYCLAHLTFWDEAKPAKAFITKVLS